MNKKLYRDFNTPKFVPSKRLLRIFKITNLFLLLFTLNIYALGIKAQTKTVTIKQEVLTISQVIKEVEKQTEFLFIYSKQDVDLNRKVKLHAHEVSVSALLQEAFEQSGLTYEVKDVNIVLKRKSQIAMTNHDQQQKTRSLTGVIKDSNGEPIIGASVIEVGTTNGTVSDLNGKFTLSSVRGNEIQLSFIGYITQTVKIGNKTQFNLILKEDTQTLNEVVVVGFGTQKKVNLTGAVSSVKMSDALGNRPINSALSALENTVPGLQINKVSGKPGASINTNIRGVTSINGGTPLVLVDNVPMDLDMINPNDIESISVLKDAAASAIYGARAAFGVILVTTKQGQKETPIRVNYSNNFSFSNVASKIKLVTPRENLEYLNDLGVKDYWSGHKLETWFKYLDEYEKENKHPEGYVWGEDGYRYDLAPTNAYNDMLDNFGFQQSHNLSVQGGSQKSSYRVSLGIVDEDGILITNKDSYSRYNASGFINMEASKWLSIQMDVKFASSKMTTATGSTGIGSLWNIAEYTSMSPLGYGTQTKDETQLYPYATSRHAIEMHDPNINRNRDLRLLGRFILTPLTGWNIVGEYTYNWNWGAQSKTSKHITMLGANDLGLKEINKTTNYYMVNDFSDRNVINIYSTFHKKIKNHDFTIMGGFNQEEYHYEWLKGSRKDLVDQNLPSLGLATGDMTAEDAFNELALRSLFYRINYAYKDRYLFEANGRYDGSSRFPKKDRFGFFPSFSAAWRISQENFMENTKSFINNLKMRASWGNIGNQNTGGYYVYLPTMDTNKPKWVLNGNTDWVTSLTTPGLVSKSLTWETVSTLDFGFDVTLLNRLNLTADYYIRNTTNMLGPSSPLPSVLGVDAPKANIASLRTKGWELYVEWKDKIGKEFSYRIAANIYDSQSEITDYYNPTKLLYNNSNLSLRKGMKYGEIWGYETDRYLTPDDFNSDGTVKDGIVLMQGQTKVYPGDIIFKDRDHNNEISPGDATEDNPGDMVVIGNRMPRYQFGLNLNAEYKNFDISLFFNGIGKRDMWLPLFPNNGQYVKGVEQYQMDYWTENNPNAFFPRISEKTATGSNYNRQTKYVKDGSYLRLKNLTIGYNCPKEWCKKWSLQNFRIFISGENLFTIHNLPEGYMPDSYDTNVGGLSMGSTASGDSYSGFYTYPLMRQLSFGINITF